MACLLKSHPESDIQRLSADCRALPSSLLLLSRAFTVTLPVGGETSEFDSLKDTIGALPNKVINEVGMEATAADGYAHRSCMPSATLGREDLVVLSRY